MIEDSQIKRAIHILKKIGHGYLYGPDREVSEAFVLAINALRAHLEHRIPVTDREPDAVAITESRLHQYLAEAYRRGASHQKHGVPERGHLIPFPGDMERVYRQSETWALEFIDLRKENGLIGPPVQPEEEEG